MVAADFDDDGHLDLVASVPAAQLWLFLGKGGGSFHPPKRIAAAEPLQHLAVGDLNHDGLPDLVAALHGQERLATYLGKRKE